MLHDQGFYLFCEVCSLGEFGGFCYLFVFNLLNFVYTSEKKSSHQGRGEERDFVFGSFWRCRFYPLYVFILWLSSNQDWEDLQQNTGFSVCFGRFVFFLLVLPLFCLFWERQHCVLRRRAGMCLPHTAHEWGNAGLCRCWHGAGAGAGLMALVRGWGVPRKGKRNGGTEALEKRRQ